MGAVIREVDEYTTKDINIHKRINDVSKNTKGSTDVLKLQYKELFERSKPESQRISERVLNSINNLPHLAAEAYCDLFLKHPDGDFLGDEKKAEGEEFKKKLELMIHAIGISCVDTLADTDKMILTKRDEFKDVEQFLNSFQRKMSEKIEMERATGSYSKLPGDSPKPEHFSSEAARRLAIYERVGKLYSNVEKLLTEDKDLKDLPDSENGKSTAKTDEPRFDNTYKDIVDAIQKVVEIKDIFAKIKNFQKESDNIKNDLVLANAEKELALNLVESAKGKVLECEGTLNVARETLENARKSQSNEVSIENYKSKYNEYKLELENYNKAKDGLNKNKKDAKNLEKKLRENEEALQTLENAVNKQNTDEFKNILTKFNIENPSVITEETVNNVKKKLLDKCKEKAKEDKGEADNAGKRAKEAENKAARAKKRAEIAGKRARESEIRYKAGNNILDKKLFKHKDELESAQRTLENAKVALECAKDIQKLEEYIAIHANSIKETETSFKDKVMEIDGKIKKMQEIMEKSETPSDEQKKELEKLVKEIGDAESVKNNILASREEVNKKDQELLKIIRGKLEKEKEALGYERNEQGKDDDAKGLKRLAKEDLEQLAKKAGASQELANVLKRTAIYTEQDAMADRDQALESLQKIKDAFVAEDQERLKGSGEAHIPIDAPKLRFSINGVFTNIREVIKWTRSTSTGETIFDLKPDLGETIEEVITRVSDKDNTIRNKKYTKRFGKWVKTVGDWEGYLEIPGVKANERKKGIARIINRKEMDKVIEDGKIKAREFVLSDYIEKAKSEFFEKCTNEENDGYKFIKGAMFNIRENDIVKEMDNPTQGDNKRVTELLKNSKVQGDTNEEISRNALRYAITERLAIENLARQKVNNDIELDTEKKKIIDKKSKEYVDDNKHRYIKHEQTYDMEASRQWGFRENRTSSGEQELDFFFDEETKPDRKIKHDGMLALTAEEIRNGFMINMKRHMLMLPNGHERSLDSFDWIKTDCDEKTGITLIRKGPAKLSYFNLSMIASLTKHNPELSRAIEDVKRERRNCLDARIEWLESSIRSNNLKDVDNVLNSIRASENEELKHSAKATRELGNPPADTLDMANFRNKKRAERNGIDLNKVKYSSDSRNYMSKAVQDQENRIKTIILQVDTQKKQSLKEKDQKLKKNNAVEYVNRTIPFMLLIDPKKGEGQGGENIKNREANGLDLIKEYSRYKYQEDFSDDKNVADYLEKIAMEFRTNSNIPTFYTNQWYLEQAHEAAKQGNFFGKTEKDGRYSEGAIDSLRKLKPGHLPLDPQENPLASLRQTYEYYWITSLHKAVYEAKEARSEKIVADALTATKDMQAKMQKNLDNAKKALDPGTSPEETNKLLNEMNSIKYALHLEINQETANAVKDKNKDTIHDYVGELTNKSIEELCPEIGEEGKKIWDKSVKTVIDYINSLDDLTQQRKARERAQETIVIVFKEISSRLKQEVDKKHQLHMLAERKKLMEKAMWNDTIRWWFLSMCQGAQQGAMQSFQRTFDEIFKDALTSVR